MSEIEGFDAHLEARATRAKAIVSAVHEHLDGMSFATQERCRDLVAVCLDALAQSFRDHADRVTVAGKKGHLGSSRELLRVAEEVIGVKVYVERLEYADKPTLDQRTPGEALDAVAGELPDVEPAPGFDLAALESVKAYLRGDTDDLPDTVTNNLPGTIIGVDGSPEPISKEESLAMVYGIPLPDVEASPVTADPLVSDLVDVVKALITGRERAQASVEDFFASVGRPDYDGPRLTLAELRKPPACPPEPGRHLSVSSISDYVECGLKFRIGRREIGVAELPAWWNVGGNAFHAAIERLEMCAATFGWESDVVAGMCAELANEGDGPWTPWMKFLSAEIVKVEEDSGVASAQWRAAKGGKEGFDWWRVEGGDMVRRYVNMRDPNRRILHLADEMDNGVPALERAFLLDVEGVPVKGFVDQVWYANAPDSIMIDDLKAGSSKPGDTFQLGVYAHAILAQLHDMGRTDITRAFGRYYMARTGDFTPTVNLLEAHPWDEIVYRVHQVDQADRAGIYPARTSGLGGGPCGTCGVKRACPIGGK